MSARNTEAPREVELEENDLEEDSSSSEFEEEFDAIRAADEREAAADGREAAADGRGAAADGRGAAKWKEELRKYCSMLERHPGPGDVAITPQARAALDMIPTLAGEPMVRIKCTKRLPIPIATSSSSTDPVPESWELIDIHAQTALACEPIRGAIESARESGQIQADAFPEEIEMNVHKRTLEIADKYFTWLRCVDALYKDDPRIIRRRYEARFAMLNVDLWGLVTDVFLPLDSKETLDSGKYGYNQEVFVNEVYFLGCDALTKLAVEYCLFKMRDICVESRGDSSYQLTQRLWQFFGITAGCYDRPLMEKDTFDKISAGFDVRMGLLTPGGELNMDLFDIN